MNEGKNNSKKKKHSFRSLIAKGMRYHLYECFCFQIHLTKLNVWGEPGNNLHKKSVFFGCCPSQNVAEMQGFSL